MIPIKSTTGKPPNRRHVTNTSVNLNQTEKSIDTKNKFSDRGDAFKIVAQINPSKILNSVNDKALQEGRKSNEVKTNLFKCKVGNAKCQSKLDIKSKKNDQAEMDVHKDGKSSKKHCIIKLMQIGDKASKTSSMDTPKTGHKSQEKADSYSKDTNLPSEKSRIKKKTESKTVSANERKVASLNSKKKKKDSRKWPRKINSPKTEVSRWSPYLCDGLSKPYYEAWLDTTLASVIPESDLEKLNIKRESFIQSYRNEQQRLNSPELFYERSNDEKYMGKIKVTHRKLGR